MQTIEEIKKFYNRECRVYDKDRYATGTRYVRADEEICKLLLKNIKGSTVLELGAGTGRYGILLKEYGFKWSGIDISEGMISKALEKEESLDITEGNVEDKRLYPSEYFDNVICVRAFNFFNNPMRVIRNVYYTLKKGGQFILIYYNLNIFRKISIPILHDPYTVQRLYTYKQIQAMLVSVGFEVQSKRHMINLPCYIYNHFPKIVNLSLIKKFDNALRDGWIVAVITKKREK